MNYITSPDFLGFIAAFLTTLAFVPQLIKTWQSKSAKDVSFGMFFLFSLGVFLWCIYGFEIHAIPIIVANTTTFILALAILSLKVFYESNIVE